MAPATSSRYFEAAAIIARAESLTVEGAWPSAQLIEPSAVALLAAVRDHFQKLIVGPQKQKPRRKRVYARLRRATAGPRVMLGVEAVFSQAGLIRWARTGGRLRSYGLRFGYVPISSALARTWPRIACSICGFVASLRSSLISSA